MVSDPPVSAAQRRAMHAAASGESTLGIPRDVGKEFVAALGEGHDQTTATFLAGLKKFLRGLLVWAGEEGGEEEHAARPEDPEHAARPENPEHDPHLGQSGRGGGMGNTADDMALDTDSVRSKDADGRLHVYWANISKAAVNKYQGDEIPGWEELGLDPAKMYRLLRDPDELKKAVKSFNSLPILSNHVPTSAVAHRPELVIGATGTDAAFTRPYLTNSLAIWPQAAIEAIENGERRELSAAYHYTPDMTPGVYDGEPYDGVMRDIVGNHVACVPVGRVGHDVVVGDRLKEEERMPLSATALVTKAALTGFLRPRLAKDQKLDLGPVLAGITDFKTQRALLLARVTAAVTGKLAQDQIDPEAITQLLPPILEAIEEDQPPPTDQPAGNPAGTLGNQDGPNSAVPMGNQDWGNQDWDTPEQAMIRDIRAQDARRRLGRDETPQEEDEREREDSAADARARLGRDETPAETAAREAKDKVGRDARRTARDQEANKPQPDLLGKGAMDAAAVERVVSARVAAGIRAALQGAAQTQREIRDAERAVRPYVGELTIAHDSAEAVYRTALGALGVDVAKIHPSAFSAILGMQPKPGSRPLAHDEAVNAASVAGFAARFPDAAKIRTIG